jgi:predicted GIY-YIG superfamily endonuclease
MNINALSPLPDKCEPFRRNRERFIAKASGCYVLTTYEGVVLYIGLSMDLRRRFNEHLDCPEKTSLTEKGRAVFFHWFETPETNKVERTWQNTHIQHEGALPVLNRVNSPVST